MPDMDPRTQQLLQLLPRQIEQLQILTRERGAAGYPLAAVRRQDLTKALPTPTTTLVSKQIQAAPTQADYNNLQKDVATLFAMLRQIAEAIR